MLRLFLLLIRPLEMTKKPEPLPRQLVPTPVYDQIPSKAVTSPFTSTRLFRFPACLCSNTGSGSHRISNLGLRCGRIAWSRRRGRDKIERAIDRRGGYPRLLRSTRLSLNGEAYLVEGLKDVEPCLFDSHRVYTLVVKRSVSKLPPSTIKAC
jgi:hypothetical protein